MKTWRPSARGLILMLAAGMGLLLCVADCSAQPPRPRAEETTPIRGSIVRMTTAPKGEVDGAVLDNGTSLHWPPHLERRFSQALQVGDRVEAFGRTETAPRGEVHFEVDRVTNLRTNTIVQNDAFDDGPPPPPRGRGRRGPPPPPVREQAVQSTTVRGVAQRFTTARKGEVDGVVLNDGIWLHWPPHLDDQFSNAVKIGDSIEAVGFTETAPRGEVHFEVRSVTNTRTNKTVQNPDLADRGPIGGDAARSGPERVGSRDQRLRELQDQIDRLQREIERLRAEK